MLLVIRPHLQPSRVEGLEGRTEIVWAGIKACGMKLLVGFAYQRLNYSGAAYRIVLRDTFLSARPRSSTTMTDSFTWGISICLMWTGLTTHPALAMHPPPIYWTLFLTWFSQRIKSQQERLTQLKIH